MKKPDHDTTRLLDDLRTAQISHLLVAAVVEFDVGSILSGGPLGFSELCERLGLRERPAIVLLTGLCSIGIIEVLPSGAIALTGYGQEKLDPGSAFHLRGYLGLGGLSADVQNMITCLKNDTPAGDVSFVYHDNDTNSALDDPDTSNLLTRAMADRARNVAPILADQLSLNGAQHLVDVGGGHGLYSLELLKANPGLRATILDRAPALEVAAEYAAAAELAERVELVCCDAHSVHLDDAPDVVLLANLLHDYDAQDAERLTHHFAHIVSPGGRVLVLDSLLESIGKGMPPVSKGPRPVAAYSALLFSICEGRCYRRDEVEDWLAGAGLRVDPTTISLPAHGSVLTGWKY